MRKFSSPSGDGLVPAGTDYNTQIRTIFVPTWRWVNFLISCATRLALLCSSPGWDGVIPKRKSLKPMKHTVFVPEWGWVGSQSVKPINTTIQNFSSPLGVGLVLDYLKAVHRGDLYFRPRVGMGWFQKIIFKGAKNNDFRPRVGMGWFQTTSKQMTQICKFSSPLGDGLVP